MDFDAEIDAQLEALSDCSSDDLQDDDDDINEDLLALIPSGNVSGEVDWLKLFLEKTSAQSRKTENILCDAEEILKEADENVNRCSSRLSKAAECSEMGSDDGIEEKTFSRFNNGLSDAHLREADNVDENAIQIRADIDGAIEEEADICVNQHGTENKFLETNDAMAEEDFNRHKLETDRKILEFEMSCGEDGRMDDIEAERLESQLHLAQMEEAERKILLELDRQRKFYENERKNKAACSIQTFYRGYAVRKQHGSILRQKLVELKERRMEERIRAIEESRAAMNLTKQVVHTHDENVKNAQNKTIEETLEHKVNDADNFPNTEQQTSGTIQPVNTTSMHGDIRNDISSPKSNIIKVIEQDLVALEATEHLLPDDPPVHKIKPNPSIPNSLQDDLKILEKEESLSSKIDDKTFNIVSETFNQESTNAKISKNEELHKSYGEQNDDVNSSGDCESLHQAINKDLALLQASMHFSSQQVSSGSISAEASDTNADVTETDETEIYRGPKNNLSTASHQNVDELGLCNLQTLETTAENIELADEISENDFCSTKPNNNHEFAVDLSMREGADSPASTNHTSYVTTPDLNDHKSVDAIEPSQVDGLIQETNETSIRAQVEQDPGSSDIAFTSVMENADKSDSAVFRVCTEGELNDYETIEMSVYPPAHKSIGSANKITVTSSANEDKRMIMFDDETNLVCKVEDTSAHGNTDMDIDVSVDAGSADADAIQEDEKTSDNFTHRSSDALKPDAHNVQDHSLDVDKLHEKLVTWQCQCVKWEAVKPNLTVKTTLRRTIRRSSAAKKLPPFSEIEILNGKWPNYKELPEDRSIETLSRISISETDGHGRNLTNIHRCVNLTHLTLTKCGLVSLEGLQACPSIRHINASHNNISVVSCDGMKRLESLVAISNRLTSIHGLMGCSSLLLLDLSHNNITKINGLESTISLTHLRLSCNQLLNISGLHNVHSLLCLDVAHNNLSALDGIEECGLLRCINASHNCFTEIPAKNLPNAVLLAKFDLSGNSISSIEFENADIPYIWLPSLIHLDLHANKISLENTSFSVAIMPQLHCLNLCQNLIANADALLAGLQCLPCFSELSLSGNLFSKDQEIQVLDTARESGVTVLFSGLNEAACLSSNKQDDIIKTLLTYSQDPSMQLRNLSSNDDSFLKTLTAQTNEYLEIISNETTELKTMRGWKSSKRKSAETLPELLQIPADLFACHSDYLKKHFETAVGQRLRFESSGKAAFQQNQLPNRNEISNESSSITVHECGDETNTQHMQEKVSKKSEIKVNNKEDEINLSGHLEVSIKPNLFSESVGNEQVDENVIAHEPKEGKMFAVTSSTSTKLVYQQLQQYKVAGTMEKVAAGKIQTFWRMSLAQRRYKNVCKKRNKAATIIQSLWKGYVVRRNIKKAFVSFNDLSEFDDEFEEVDLSQLDFDEDSYDQQWAFKTDIGNSITPRMPSRGSFSPSIPFSKPISPTQPMQSRRNATCKDDDNSHQLWHKISSFSKPPLPPITPTESSSTREHQQDFADRDSTFVLDSHRSKHSRTEEALTNEWGLQSSSATELMLKRARKMKGRRKKEINADEKLRRFQDMSQRVTQHPIMTQRKAVQSQNRMEYFKAREMMFEERDKKPSEDDERRRQYTYEWLHTKADCSQPEPSVPQSRDRHAPADNHSRRHTCENGSTKSGFLPIISKQRSLVSPNQQSDMEVMSISSFNSNRSRSKHLLRDIARRHSGYGVIGSKR